MKSRTHFILYTILGLSAAILLAVAIRNAGDARERLNALEQTHTQQLLEAQEHLQAIAIKLNKAPAALSAPLQVELLTGVSKQADGVVSGLTALPLSHVAMSSTIRFCNQLSDYSLRLALLAASGKPLTQTDMQTLAQLESQCTQLLSQLTLAREHMLARSLRMATDEAVFFAEASDERPIESVGDPDNGVDYPSMIYDGAFSDARRRGEPLALGEGMATAEEALAIATAFIGPERVAKAEPFVPSGGAIPCHGVKITLRDGLALSADVTQQGGKLLWIMPEHASFAPALTLEECTQAARAFLESRGYGPMEADHYQLYDGLAVINFVSVQDGVWLYPDLVKVQLRMDTGELVGLESNNYLMNHTQRQALSPAVTEGEARALVEGRMEVRSVKLCVIPYRSAERLCWEVAGEAGDDSYRVYVDAASGEVIEVLMMILSPDGVMAA